MLGLILRNGGTFLSLLTLLIFAGILLGIPLVITIISLLRERFGVKKQDYLATAYARVDPRWTLKSKVRNVGQV